MPVDRSAWLGSVPPLLLKLMTIRILLSLIALALTLQSSNAEGASLYDASQAQQLTPEQAARFGPQAANYRYDSRMIRAAAIAQQRAQKRSASLCWRYVKTALLQAGAVDSYPKTAFAKQAAQELPKSFGFKRIRCRDPRSAPLGSVLVYGGKDAGHVEIRTVEGYVSDFRSATPYEKRPLIGVFIKPRA
jgi:hypothetical protein